ncbi:MAG: NADH-quinone oxidoreductase subunit C [Puniceicoccaceae bacterium]|nr:MAG: NADH-quinone oxidoreductase subunit C [Puniceicoccaceae bacterium]
MTAAEFPPEVRERFPEVSERPSVDCKAFNCPPERLPAFLQWLRDALDFDLLTDISGVDWNDASPRFSVVYHLYSTRRHGYVRVVTDCPSDDEPAVPSVVPLWPGANWHERETYDMFGIRFTGHPDLRRILMWDGYEYYPLRKDFPLAGFETDLPDAEVAAETGAKVQAAPMAGGPFVAPTRGTMKEREPRAKDESWTEKKPKPRA